MKYREDQYCSNCVYYIKTKEGIEGLCDNGESEYWNMDVIDDFYCEDWEQEG